MAPIASPSPLQGRGSRRGAVEAMLNGRTTPLPTSLRSATLSPEGERDKSLLRFITCGSVDDGKSTLIGRLLHDTGAVAADQLDELTADSRRHGTQGSALDLALLVDGLAAEREQGITIDVAYRFFATPRRSFIVADTPGHEQYTRNMVTGASTADAAVILLDARKGVLTQTRRHSWLVHLLGIRELIVAVNKMDLVEHDQARFDAIVADYAAFARGIGIERFSAVPLSGLTGENVTSRAATMPWHDGPTLLEALEIALGEDDRAASGPFRMGVQWVNRPDADFRGFAGTIASGAVQPGDAVRVVPSGRTSRVARIVTFDGDRALARVGEAVTLVLADEVDCSRGDVIAAATDAPAVTDEVSATLVWLDERPLVPGGGYWLKLGSRLVGATVAAPDHVVDVNTQAKLAAPTLRLNDIGVATVGLDGRIAFTPFADGPELGGFILIDRATNATVAAGLIRHATRPAGEVHWQASAVTREGRARQKGQSPRVLWFTGLSGAGKSTLANLVEQRLHALGRHTALLDGDNLRHGLCRDLGFSAADRAENVRRVGEVAALLADAGLIVLVALVSPFRAERDGARATLPPGEFVEIFVDTPIAVAEERDVKGLYAKARAGVIPEFTGLTSPYEPPLAPELIVDTGAETAEVAAARIVEHLLGVWSYDL